MYILSEIIIFFYFFLNSVYVDVELITCTIYIEFFPRCGIYGSESPKGLPRLEKAVQLIER